jgi:hypothetical protein
MRVGRILGKIVRFLSLERVFKQSRLELGLCLSELILADERASSLTRIAATESISLCEGMKADRVCRTRICDSRRHFVKLNLGIATAIWCFVHL